MSVAVIGCDPSSKKFASAIFIDGEFLKFTSAPLSEYKADVGRCLMLAQKAAVRSVLAAKAEIGVNDPVYFFIESPFFNPRMGAGSLIPLTRAGGAMIAGAASAGAKVEEVSIAYWKKQVLGNGNASKEEITAHVKENYPDRWALKPKKADQDCMDAHCIGEYGLMIIERMNRI